MLFPALLFNNTSTINLSGDLLSSFAVAIYAGFGGAVIYALASSKLVRLNGPTASSVLQGAARLIGAEGLALAALLIPVTNTPVVTLMVMMIHGGGAPRAVIGAVLCDLTRNPLRIAVFLGIAANLLGATSIPNPP